MLVLRPYQIEDVIFLSKRSRAGCFNEQRTGKTPTALKTMERHKKILIICPASAIYQWQEEFINWLQRPCVVVDGTPKIKQQIIKQWSDGLVVSYDTLKPTARSLGSVNEILKHKPEGVILDEAHRIRNRKSAAAKAAFLCQKIPHRLALTATLAHRTQHDAVPILMWLYPEKFPSYWKTIEYFFYINKLNNKYGQTYYDIGNFKPDKEIEFLNILNIISTQRKRIDVMPWLPIKDPPVQIKLPCTLEQKKYINELEQYYETENIIVQGYLDKLIRIRQICLHPKLLNLKGESPKVNWIKQYIKDYPEKPIIIFSKFTSFLKLLEKELLNESIGIIIGDTSKKERNNLKQSFQKENLKILLINIDVGKEALTLDKAEVIIFTDKFPPAGDIAQAEDRFIATTEINASVPKQIIELMIKKTYDEQLYNLVKQNKNETDIINDYKKYLKGVERIGI